ncbi:hypothetical protein GCM10025868_06480 [Angustibacter aerolatus]|uniref:Uncharacterized protein n=1 Tax=Angustibacter aerolatus TaxID=1162965 RepID=A0ABQ6JD83_9ACTN|nr:hypothetical protein [Angustibacter aerolatus]GMA85398.1 hypothetical protein GCM10025868_06480 [Angustibacter aerolatus]
MSDTSHGPYAPSGSGTPLPVLQPVTRRRRPLGRLRRARPGRPVGGPLGSSADGATGYGVVSGGRSRPAAASAAPVLFGIGATVLLGLLLGLLWWALAPVARAQVQGDQVLLQGHAERRPRRTAGSSSSPASPACWWPPSSRCGRRVARRCARSSPWCSSRSPGSSPGGSASLLGPSSLVEQVRAGDDRPLTPLALHALSALAAGPLLCAVTLFVAALLSGGPAARAPGR